MRPAGKALRHGEKLQGRGACDGDGWWNVDTLAGYFAVCYERMQKC